MKNLWNMKVTFIPIVVFAVGTVSKGLQKGLEDLKKKKNRTSRDYPNYNIIKIVQNTEKSPGDLGRLAVTQTSVKNHQLILMWKTFKK